MDYGMSDTSKKNPQDDKSKTGQEPNVVTDDAAAQKPGETSNAGSGPNDDSGRDTGKKQKSPSFAEKNWVSLTLICLFVALGGFVTWRNGDDVMPWLVVSLVVSSIVIFVATRQEFIGSEIAGFLK